MRQTLLSLRTANHVYDYHGTFLIPPGTLDAEGKTEKGAVRIYNEMCRLLKSGELAVPTLGSTTRIRVPAGTPSGKVFRLAGRGMKQAKGRPGDLHVKVRVEVPHPLSPTQRDAVAGLAATLDDASYPDRADYDAALAARSTFDSANR